MSFYGNARGPFDWSLCLNLETAVGSQQSLQVLGAPRKTAKCLITTKVTTTFFLLWQVRQGLARTVVIQLLFLGSYTFQGHHRIYLPLLHLLPGREECKIPVG